MKFSILCRAAAALVFLSLPALAQVPVGYVQVNGTNIADSSGVVVANATIAFAPVNSAGQPIGYQVNGSGQAITSPVTTLVTNGAFGIRLADTSLTNPVNVCFSVTVTDNVSGKSYLGPGYTCFQPAGSGPYVTNGICTAATGSAGGTCNWDKFPPNLPGLVIQQTGPTGPMGPTGPAGPMGGSLSYPGVTTDSANGLAITGASKSAAVLGTAVGGSYYASQYPGQANNGIASTFADASKCGIGTLATVTAGSNQITVQSPTGISTGQLITAAGIPANTTVTLVTGNVITMSASATVSGIGPSGTPSQIVGVTFGAGCNVVADPGYPMVESPWNGQQASFPALGGSMRQLSDLRGGARTIVTHDPRPNPFWGGSNDANTLVCHETNFQGAPVGGNSTALNTSCLNMIYWSGGPGADFGYPAGLSAGQGWTVSKILTFNSTVNTPGISEQISAYQSKAGIGDTTSFYFYNYNYGGAIAPSDEGNPVTDAAGGEASISWTGTVNTGGGGAGATTISTHCTGDCANPGDGRYFFDEGPGQVQACNATAKTLPSGSTPGNYTFDCATPIPQSSMWGTVHAAINTPSGSPYGKGYANVTFQLDSGPGNTGSPTVGGPICFGEGGTAANNGDFHEQTQITSFTGTGPWQVTAPLRKPHFAGTWVMEGGGCGQYVEFVANTVTSTGGTQGAQVLRYPVDITGCTAPNQCQVSYFSYLGPAQFPQGNVVFAQPTGSITNTGGILALGGLIGAQHPELLGQPTMTITGASNSAFNGTCLNSFQNTSGFVSCTQLSSVGQTAATSGSVGIGTTGYGNTAVNIYHGAEVLDVLDYSESACEAAYPSKPHPAAPCLDGTFNIEYNTGQWANGSTVENTHHYSLKTSMSHNNVSAWNPMATDSPGWNLGLSGTIGGGNVNQPTQNRAAIGASNFASASNFTYHGGTRNAPGGIGLGFGPFNYGLWMQFAPDPIGSSVNWIGCPYSGCTDPNYFYYGQTLSGNGSNNGWFMKFTPFSSSMTLNASGGLRIQTPVDWLQAADNITFIPMTTPANSGSTTSTTNGQLAANTYYYKIVGVNTAGGLSLQSAEIPLPTTGSTSLNTLKWTRSQGATKYAICQSTTSGAELFLAYTINGTGDITTYVDNGTITPSGACPSATTAARGGIEQADHVSYNSSGTSFEAIVKEPAGLAGNINLSWPIVGGTVALTAQIAAVRAGAWTITSATSAAVSFSPAFNTTPTSCAVTPTADPTAVGAIWYTSLTTSGMTVNVHTSGTIAGTYQCVVNASSPTRRGPPRRRHPPGHQLPAPPRRHPIPPHSQLPAKPRRERER